MNTSLFPLIPIAHAVTISMNIPGNTPNSTSTPGAYIANFYQFALMVGGVLAFGVIIYGGVRYMASAGNPSGQSDAKEWIEGALLGLLLLVGAYFVLNVINPQLLNLKLPTLTQANVQAPAAGSSPMSGTVSSQGASNCTPACTPPATCQLSADYDAFGPSSDQLYTCL
jgi:hypothetical protein